MNTTLILLPKRILRVNLYTIQRMRDKVGAALTTQRFCYFYLDFCPTVKNKKVVFLS